MQRSTNLHSEHPIRILIAEDDRSNAALMQRVLAEDGYAIDIASTGDEARMFSLLHDYDGVVLDLDLADRDGFEILDAVRKSGRATPVLLCTGLDDPQAIVRGLDAGADGYIVTPVGNPELRALVRSLLRRGSGSPIVGEVVVGDVRLNRLTRRVTRGINEIDVTPMELRLLEHFMLHAGQVVTRSQLHHKVWDRHFDPSSNLVDAHIARLRKKLERSKASVELQTRRGVGFLLQAAAAAA